MIVIDVGNTNIVIGIYLKNKLNKVFRINTEKNKKKFKLFFENFLKSHQLIFKTEKKICVLSSVVPQINSLIKNIFLKNKFNFFIIDPKKVSKNIKINYKLSQIGYDRVANFVAVHNKKIPNSIIVDLGTATTFDIIKKNEYYGGIIFPGITLSMNSLVNNAELLKKSKISKVKKIVARDTTSSIKSGFYFGYLHAINGIIRQIIKENKFRPKIIITGGLGIIFKDKIDFNPIYDEYLTLEGIKLIGMQLYDK